MKHSFWHQIPVARLLLPFAAGIGISMFYPMNLEAAVSLFTCALLCSFFIYVRFQSYSHRWLFGVGVLCCVFFGGFALHAWQSDLSSATHYRCRPEAEYILVMVDEQPIAKTSSYKMRCKALSVIDSMGNTHVAEGKLVLYIEKTPTCAIQYGDIVVFPYAQLQPVKPPQNPDEFDYKRYLAFNNIFDQAYSKADELVKLPVNKGNPLLKWVYRVQHYFKGVLSRCIASTNETGVAEALLYGYDDDIDAETVQAYSNTGTLHVLAVSGMHVGIIFMIMGLVLKPMDKNKQLKLMKNIVILAVLWLYSLLCGLSPSILRATVMFSFIIFSSILNIRSNVYNTLAASAFVLLCVDSNMLANVGFQLSYLAVLGIVFFQSFIYNWYIPSNWFADEIWKITSVSLAAQITTFPIGLLYFHQFPNCFLFSNLIIIPLTTLILYMAMVLLVIAKFSWLSWLLGQALFYTIAFTNSIVKVVEAIPYAYVNGIHISILQSILLYGMLGSVTAYFLLRRIIYLQSFLLTAICFFVLQGIHQVENDYQNRVVVYSVRHASAVHLIKGNEAYLLGDSALLNNKDKMKFHVQQHIWKSGIRQTQSIFLDSGWRQIHLPNYTALISGRSRVNVPVLPYDMFIIQNGLNEEQLNRIQPPRQVIITSAVGHQRALAIKEYWQRKNIPVRYVGETGAIEVSLPH
ncbi:MAG: ComEC/Rec2 family competence protein [Bacteroidota bacterium]